MRRNKRKGQRGFSLVELVIVIAILGVLVAIVAPRAVGVLTNAKENADKANVRMVQTAVDLYYADNGEYPQATSWDELGEILTNKDGGEDGKVYIDPDEWPDSPQQSDKQFTYDKTTGKVKLEDK